MLRVNVGELRDRLSELLRRAEHGETIVVMRRGREVAVLRGRGPGPAARRLLGCMKGTARVRDDIVQPLDATWFASRESR